MTVYALVGWFGDVNWTESVYATAALAEQACEEAWKTQRSKHPSVPDYVQGLCKFGVEEYEVIGASSRPSGPPPPPPRPRVDKPPAIERRGI